MIEGVRLRKLKAIGDYRGQLMELFRSDWPEFIKFGQVYLTTCKPNVVKGWHYHKIQTDTFLCFMREVKIVLYDSREDSRTKGEIMEFIVGKTNPQLIQIPPYVYHGFMGIGKQESIIINVPTELYAYKDPDEYRIPFDSKDIPYTWGEGVIGG
ncbi:MAG: dTDP-4-dehydrorhamnose 3,5-epimerase family protein [bacterium]